MTGKEVWRFHVVPQPGDENFGTWGLNGWQDRRGPGVWVPMTVDLGQRPRVRSARQRDRSELRQQPSRHRTSMRRRLARARAATGKRKWHYQITHHDIYDWDVELRRRRSSTSTENGTKIPARRADDEAGPAVHVQPADRRAAVRRRRASGAAVRRARRSGLADAAVPGEAAGRSAHEHDARRSQQDLAGVGEGLHRALRQVGAVGPLHAVRHGAEPRVSGFGRRRQLGGRVVRSDARPGLRQHAHSRRHRAAAADRCRRACCRRSASQDPTNF